VEAARSWGGGIRRRGSLEGWWNLGIECLQDAARRGGDQLRVGIRQHGERDCGSRTLEQIHINCRTRRGIETIIMHVADDADYGEQARIAVHVAEFDGVADGSLPGPART